MFNTHTHTLKKKSTRQHQNMNTFHSFYECIIFYALLSSKKIHLEKLKKINQNKNLIKKAPSQTLNNFRINALIVLKNFELQVFHSNLE